MTPLLVVVCILVTSASAFLQSTQTHRRGISSILLSSQQHALIDISENSPRNIIPLYDWSANVGIQICDSLRLVNSGDDGNDNLDICASTNAGIPAGSPVIYVPSESMLMGSYARSEYGDDAYDAEMYLANAGKDSQTILHFYLFLKIIKEYELGDTSLWYSYLDSLPRYYSNGASMTDFCFGCLPPYAAELSLADKRRLVHFVRALAEVPSVSYESRNNAELTSWAYAVIRTRCIEFVDQSDVCLVPMVDYFNHGGVMGVNVELAFDEYGNCQAYTTRDVGAGESLRICYGDSTNPSELLARYGFLDESSSATFCKIVIDNPSPALVDLGYHPSRMLFYNDGSIADEIWDVLCYQELGKVSHETQLDYYSAHMTGDEGRKQAYHEQYLPYTVSALRAHVNYLLNELEELGMGLEIQKNQGRDAIRHPRISLILCHNEFVKKTLDAVQWNLDSTFP